MNKFKNKRKSKYQKRVTVSKKTTGKPNLSTPSETTDMKDTSIYEVREIHASSSFSEAGSLLSKARMQWQFAEWSSLGKIDLLMIEHHPDRAELALLAGCAAFQEGEKEKGKIYLNSAIKWGCDKRKILQVLMSGIYNVFGCYYTLNGNTEKARIHFEGGGNALGGDSVFIADQRQRKENERLSLVNQNITSTSHLLIHTEKDNQLENEVPEKIFSMDDAIQEATLVCTTFKEGIISYAQNFEDVMLWRAFKNVQDGFYIDIGAQHPTSDSVSKAFYEKGWRGIHVEATPTYAQLLREDRPDEIVIEAAVSDHHGSITFYEIPDTGISTGDAQIAEMHRNNGFPIKVITVPTITLSDVFCLAGGREIHWMKIDVEGMEKAVLEGWGKCLQRPRVVLIESTMPNSQVKTNPHWEYILIELGYCFAYFDGLSSFYVLNDDKKTKELFKTPPNVFDNFALKRDFIK